MLLLVYVLGGLFGFLMMILWNHGFLDGGADVLPVWFEIALFIVWIAVGLGGLFLLTKKSLKKSFLVVLWAVVAFGVFIAYRYITSTVIPDMVIRNKIDDIKDGADDLCDVPIDYRYITFYMDTDENEMHYWDHSDEEPEHYDTLETFSMKEVDVKFSDLNQSLVMYKFTSNKGEIYCLSGPEYYSEIEQIYWLYDGQMYYATVENIMWYGEKEELWEKYSYEYFDKRNGR